METILFGVIPVIAFMGLVARSVLRGRLHGADDDAATDAVRSAGPPEYRTTGQTVHRPATGTPTAGRGGSPEGYEPTGRSTDRHGFDWTRGGR